MTDAIRAIGTSTDRPAVRVERAPHVEQHLAELLHPLESLSEPQVAELRAYHRAVVQDVQQVRQPVGPRLPMPHGGRFLDALERFFAKWDADHDGTLTEQEVQAARFGARGEELAALDALYVMMGGGKLPRAATRDGLRNAIQCDPRLGKTLDSLMKDFEKLPPLPKNGLQSQGDSGLKQFVEGFFLNMAAKMASVASKLHKLSMLPGFKAMAPIADVMSGVSNGFRLAAGEGDMEEAAKNLLSTVKSAISAVSAAFPGTLAKVKMAGKVAAKGTPVLGILVSGVDSVVSRVKQGRAASRGDEAMAAVWELKATLDTIAGVAQLGATLGAAGAIPSAGGSLPVFAVLEAAAILVAVVCEIVGHLAESQEQQREPKDRPKR